jgi:predicted nucleic-acid-binding Zn-ribbon protein
MENLVRESLKVYWSLLQVPFSHGQHHPHPQFEEVTEAPEVNRRGRSFMPLNQLQQQTLKDWMRSKAVIQCPACGEDRWQFGEASYVRALLEADDMDLTEGGGVVKISCDNCGYVALFDAETLGIRGLWDRGRDL